jgi:hypothetical protein
MGLAASNDLQRQQDYGEQMSGEDRQQIVKLLQHSGS